MVRGVRGATIARDNTAEEIFSASSELLSEMMIANSIVPDDIACIFFSATPDLNAAFPAAAARGLGLSSVPLFGMQEMEVPGNPARCIRILILLNTDRPPGELKHIYLREAKALRPDLT